MAKYVISVQSGRRSETSLEFQGESIEEAMLEAARVWPYPDATDLGQWKNNGVGRRIFDRWAPSTTLFVREVA